MNTDMHIGRIRRCVKYPVPGSGHGVLLSSERILELSAVAVGHQEPQPPNGS